MKVLTKKTLPYGSTSYWLFWPLSHFRAWVYTESPLGARCAFSADVVAIAPDVAGLITHVNVHDNQLVRKDRVLFTIDQPRYQKAGGSGS